MGVGHQSPRGPRHTPRGDEIEHLPSLPWGWLPSCFQHFSPGSTGRVLLEIHLHSGIVNRWASRVNFIDVLRIVSSDAVYFLN